MRQNRPDAGEGPARPGRRKVVLLLQDLAYGGTQRQSLELASGLDPARYKVELWMLMAGDDLAREARSRGLVTRWLGRGAWVSPAVLLRLWQELGRQRVDLLVLLTVVPNIWGRLIGRLRPGLKVAATCRGGGAVRRQHERLLRRLCDAIICNSRDLEEELRAIHGPSSGRVARIANGVDCARFSPAAKGAADDPEVVVCLARLVDLKDHDTLLAAFARLAARRPGARLRLVGDGPRRAGLEGLARELGIAGRVEFVGAVDDPAPILRGAAVMALASRKEAMPNAVLEAMACGAPVAATRVGGIVELVEASGAGLLVEPGDAAGLAEALERLLGDPELARAMGRAGRAAASAEYSLEAMVRQHAALFERLMQ